MARVEVKRVRVVELRGCSAGGIAKPCFAIVEGSGCGYEDGIGGVMSVMFLLVKSGGLRGSENTHCHRLQLFHDEFAHQGEAMACQSGGEAGGDAEKNIVI